MDLARSRLVNLMCDYRGLHRCEVILVFDAYRIKGNTGSFEKVNKHISVVYTKEAETADSYIERTTHRPAAEKLLGYRWLPPTVWSSLS